MMSFKKYKHHLMHDQKPGGKIFHVNNFLFTRFTIFIIMALSFGSCEKYFHPDQDLIIQKENMFHDFEDYRSVGLGLYSLQQKLFEQIIILGELRGDLVDITKNASPELVEIRNFNISKQNSYASPYNFYKLIAECNNLIRQLKTAHPEVLDKSIDVTNYDKLFGEVLCMRAWAYFTAVKIYQKIPYVPETLNTVQEIRDYVNSSANYIDSVDYIYGPKGTVIDTLINTPVTIQKQYLDLPMVVDTFTRQLENNIKAVGVDYSINNGDVSWEATVWNNYARYALLGEMYLFDLNYRKAFEDFSMVLNFSETTRFRLDSRFSGNSWRYIFYSIDPNEHILALPFNSAYRQTNDLQTLFSDFLPNKYMLKPTKFCVENWETIWRNARIHTIDGVPDSTRVTYSGIPGDFNRGYGVSYIYVKNGKAMDAQTVSDMLNEKQKLNDLKVKNIMARVDTVGNKFSLGKTVFSHDASFIVYRAADIHLYLALINDLAQISDFHFTSTIIALNIVNNGSNFNIKGPLGVRGRVGFGSGSAALTLSDIIYSFDPYTNEITGYKNLGADDLGKRQYLAKQIMDERARELAFEGQRFYDLMLMSRMLQDNSYLADKVAAKFSGSQRDQIRAKLMDPDNWYIHFYE